MGEKDKSGHCQVFYFYPEEGRLETSARVNFDPKIYAEIRARVGLNSSPERRGGPSKTVEGSVAARDTDRSGAADSGPSVTPPPLLPRGERGNWVVSTSTPTNISMPCPRRINPNLTISAISS